MASFKPDFGNKGYNEPSSNRYSKLNNFDDSDDEGSDANQGRLFSQDQLIKQQDDKIDLISDRVTNLKHISFAMQNELDSQAHLLNELDNEMEKTDSKMQTVMKKLTNVLHLSNDRRQWTAIVVLISIILVLLILLAIL